jgi:hypothetical protein
MLHKKVWDTLKVIDVSGYVEKKNGMDYLSWSFAWSALKDNFPSASVEYTDREFEDGTVEYNCTITITEGEESVGHTMWLPVLDFRNKPIVKPDAMQRNTCKMRCMVKCISLFGLGINVYQGTDIPNAGNTITDNQVNEIGLLIDASKADLNQFLKVFDIASIKDMPSEKYKIAVASLKRKIKQQNEPVEDVNHEGE